MKKLKSMCRLSGIITGAVLSLMHSSLTLAQVPLAPSDLTARGSVPGDMAVVLFWTDNSLDEDGFEIQRSTGAGSTLFETVAVRNLNNIDSYNDVGLAENTTYNYRVRAFNTQGVSDFSNVATAATGYLRPLQVTNLQGQYFEGLVSLTWTDVADNETRYEVERAEVGVSTEYTIIATLDPNSTSYVDDTPLDGTSYFYRVRPWRFNVEGGAPDFLTIETGPGLAVPGGVAAKAKSRTEIELAWNGRFPRATLIQIQRFNPDLGYWVVVAMPSANDRKYIDRRLTPRTAYSYRVRTVTATAVSPWVDVFATTR